MKVLPFKSILPVFLMLLAFSLRLSAQVTQTCVFPTEDPTLCDKFEKDPPREEIEIKDGSFSNALSDWTNQDVYINSTFTVNSSFLILHTGVRFGPSGKIVVTTNGNLYTSDSHYFGCDGWEGIEVNSNGILAMRSDQVEDAKYAVDIAATTAQINLRGCFFNRNITDIEVRPGVAANALISDNLFDCTSNTFLGSISDYGIHMGTHAILTFGLLSAPNNIVRRHLFGAQTNSSALNVRRGEFACNPVGIDAISGQLDVRTDASLTYANFFKHNGVDINTKGTELFVQASQFTECETDNVFIASNYSAEPIELRNNTFTVDNNNSMVSGYTKTAITIARSSGGSGSTYSNQIEDNGFIIDPFTANQARSAVRATGYSGTYDLMKISANTVNIGVGGSNPSLMRPTTVFDVTVNTAEGFYVLGNHLNSSNVDNSNNFNRWGFYVHDWSAPSADHKIQGNIVSGTSATYDYGMCAFHFVEAGPWDICDN